MKLAGLALLVATCLYASGGIRPRVNAADYDGQAERDGVRVAAEVLPVDDVKNMFATDLSRYIVVEVAVWPKSGASLDISPIDFALKSGTRSVRPVSGRTIAGVVQRRAKQRRDDLVLYPNVGLSTGSWGTGTAVGVGVGMGGGNGYPPPASTDTDRRVMTEELEERELADGVTSKPVAGYLFFPANKKRAGSYELVFDVAGATLSVPVSIKP